MIENCHESLDKTMKKVFRYLIAFALIFELLQNRRSSIRVHFLFQKQSNGLSMLRNLWDPTFSQMGENGDFSWSCKADKNYDFRPINSRSRQFQNQMVIDFKPKDSEGPLMKKTWLIFEKEKRIELNFFNFGTFLTCFSGSPNTYHVLLTTSLCQPKAVTVLSKWKC